MLYFVLWKALSYKNILFCLVLRCSEAPVIHYTYKYHLWHKHMILTRLWWPQIISYCHLVVDKVYPNLRKVWLLCLPERPMVFALETDGSYLRVEIWRDLKHQKENSKIVSFFMSYNKYYFWLQTWKLLGCHTRLYQHILV